MTARYLVGDVFDRMRELPDGSFDLILTSPPIEPFLALRSYLPDGHPDKAKEIGSEPTPAAFLDTMLALTAEWRRLLAPHGSIAIEIGDTYSGSGGAGGDYGPDGLRAGQERFDGSASRTRTDGNDKVFRGGQRGPDKLGNGWPLPKSLALIPELYAASLAYGRNLLTGQPSPAGMWRVRNIKPWIRSNPPVGALGDKERPATSYVTVATVAVDRWFDLDAVRTTPSRPRDGTVRHKIPRDDIDDKVHRGFRISQGYELNNPAGAPPLDWWHHADAVIDAEIDRRNGKPAANRRNAKGTDQRPNDTPSGQLPIADTGVGAVGARGVHIRRALETAGILTTHDALDVSPKGYAGAHYAVWPPELCRLLIDEMCPRKVCTTCGESRRRITETTQRDTGRTTNGTKNVGRKHQTATDYQTRTEAAVTTLGWSDCGHGTWRPGHVLDPFAGSGTTLAVCTGMARDATGIDLDQRNADLALERCGMFLEVDYGKEGVA